MKRYNNNLFFQLWIIPDYFLPVTILDEREDLTFSKLFMNASCFQTDTQIKVNENITVIYKPQDACLIHRGEIVGLHS